MNTPKKEFETPLEGVQETPDPNTRLDVLATTVALKGPRSTPPVEEKPPEPFWTETPALSSAQKIDTPKTREDWKLPNKETPSFKDRMKQMGSEFGNKIEALYEWSKEKIQGAIKNVGDFIGADKLKWWAEKMISKLQWGGILATIFGGKWWWAEKLLMKIFGIGDAQANEKWGTQLHLSGNFRTTYFAVLPFLTRGEGKNLPVQEVLGDKEFQSLPIKDLRTMYSSWNYEALKNVLPTEKDSEKRKMTFDHVCKNLFDAKSSFIAKHLEGSYKSGMKIMQEGVVPDNITLEEYFKGCALVMRWVKNIPQLALSWGRNMITSLRAENGEIKWVEDEELEGFHFSSPELRKKYLLQLLEESGRHYKFWKKEDHITAILERAGSGSHFAKLSDTEKAEVKIELTNLFSFADNFFLEIANNPKLNMGLGNDMKMVLERNGFSYGGLLLVYHIMNGRYRYDQMSVIERAQMHSIVTGIFGAGDTDTSGKLAWAYTKKLLESSEHTDIQEFVKEVAKFGGKEALKWAIGAIKWYAGFTKEAPEAWLWLLALNMPLFTSKTSALGMIW